MKYPLGIVTALLTLGVVLSGCGTGSETRISPKTMPDPTPLQTLDIRQGNYDDIEHVSSYEEEESLKLITVHFEYDKFDLSLKAMETLTSNAEALVRHPDAVIRIEGHCDDRGTEEYNMALGEKRARMVKKYLLDYGIDPANLSIISYGELIPADQGHSESAWKKNRRADFVVRSE
ncbi:MAG: OmpA family protein [candidate division Zixibacteria bacterium]